MKVSLLRCEKYELALLKDIINQSFRNMGGIEQFVKEGTKVLLKVNLLMKKTPETATTTNPVFVQALSEVLAENGAKVTIADSPGGPYTVGMLKGVYTASGMKDAAEKSGATLNYDVGYETVTCNNMAVSHSFSIIKPVLEADLVITVAKLKTHSFATYTGAVKNLFGVIPGTYKAEYHLRLPNIAEFSQMLVDICETVKPGLAFIDGIIGMEGAGPSGGTPRQINAVIASESAHLADVVATRIIGLSINDVETLKAAKERGLIPDFTVVGDDEKSFYIKDFEIPDAHKRNGIFKLMPWLGKRFSARPVLKKDICIGCADCAKNCPAKAIEMVDKKPDFDYNKCFRCYCCQELCPKTAIVVKRSKRLLF